MAGMTAYEKAYNTVDWAMRRKYNRALSTMEPVPDEPSWWDDKNVKRVATGGGCGGCSPKPPGKYKYTDPAPANPFYSWRILSAQKTPRNPDAQPGTF